MSGLAISSATLSGILRAPIAQIQTDLSQAQTEVATGRYADVGLLLGGRTADAASLHGVRARLDTFADTNGLATTRLSATQTALSSILDQAQSLQTQIIAAQAGTATPASIAGSGQSAFGTIASALNTSAGGQNVFAGINTDVRPFADDGVAGSAAVAAAFTSAFGVSPSSAGAASITPAAMQAFLNGSFAQQFASPAWETNWSSASSTAITSRISTTQVATTSATANDPALRNVVQASVLLSQLGNANLSADTRAVVLAQASKLAGQSVSDIAGLQSGVGLMQNNVSSATTANKNTQSFVDTQIGALEDADPAEVATRISNLTTQLESAYSLTAKLGQLSLVQFLPIT